ncbi:MAG TPA: penicillin-binding transpeptidase domain-containing protein [Clostridia bacterium]|nr:penicillin-binding transpeptidase domain-containing protein [Clostridia bacterium]
MRKLIPATLVLIMLLSLVPLSGCENRKRDTGEEAVGRYLEYIRTGDYASAWGMLSAATRNEKEEEVAGRITKQAFVDKYTDIFKALEITAVDYADISCGDGDILCDGSFTAIYRSAYTDDLTSRFDIVARREGGEWRIEWSPALIFPEMQWGDTVRVAKLAAKRGEILAGGDVLAATVGAVSVYAVVSKIEDATLFATQVAALLNMTQADVAEALSKPYDDVAVIRRYYSDELSDAVKEQLLGIPGIGVDYGNYGTNREYPFGSLLAHLIGYVGSVPNESEEALEAELAALNEGRSEADGLYTADSIVGRLGLEKQYEKELRGKDGELVYICTAEGANRKTIYKRNAENGNDIELTIDMQLQQRLEDVMDLVLFGDTTAGAVIVINPKTGALQAMCSYPGYDLNLFTRGISAEAYQALLGDPAKPLINRATQGLYPPGSTMKAFTAAAALDLSVLDQDYAFDESQIEDDYWTPEDYGNWIWTPIKRTHINYPMEGPLNMRKAIIHSDNIYFANCALMTGWDSFMSYMEGIGFTQAIPFDIGVATPQLHNEGTEETYKLLADSGYGQGEILVTPLQLASIFTALANGGDIMTPYVVKGLYHDQGILSKEVYSHMVSAWKTGVISDGAISMLTSMLEDVVDPDLNGTGRSLRVKNCTVAAKTGTAEIGNDKSREISWFAGYRVGVSDEDARLVLVMLEIPADDKYTQLKFDIARALLEMEPAT